MRPGGQHGGAKLLVVTMKTQSPPMPLLHFQYAPPALAPPVRQPAAATLAMAHALAALWETRHRLHTAPAHSLALACRPHAVDIGWASG